MMKTRRSMVPCISAVAGVLPWARFHEPGHVYGLAVCALLALVLLPTLLLFVVFGVPYLTAGLIPREWRANYRHRYDRADQKSARIPAWLRRATLAADRHRCAHCGSPDRLQIDHVIPWSLGGLTALFNLVTLCDVCNRTKSNYWVRRNGTVCYKPFPGLNRLNVAAAITVSERRRRLNPLRWVWAAHSLGWI
jgi:hypothetical protein